MEKFGFGLEPVIQFTTAPPAILLEYLARSSSDRVVSLLDPVKDILGLNLFDRYRRLGRLHCCSCLWAHLCSPQFGFCPTTPGLLVGLPRIVVLWPVCGMSV